MCPIIGPASFLTDACPIIGPTSNDCSTFNFLNMDGSDRDTCRDLIKSAKGIINHYKNYKMPLNKSKLYSDFKYLFLYDFEVEKLPKNIRKSGKIGILL